MTNIIIVGYPKSGNTWVTRLVAELVGCPVAGFWDSDHNEIAQEGLHRESDFRCYKSHHQFYELYESIDPRKDKVIYVIRDPRDIAVSGSAYFDIERWPSFARFITALPRGRGLYREIVNPERYRIKRMIHAVLYGSEVIHHWVRIPWATHFNPYLQQGFFFIKFEDLLAAPEYECRRILGHLGLERQNIQIREAIERQSFNSKKKSYKDLNDTLRAEFMRVGKSMQWKQKLSRKQKNLFLEVLSDELAQFSYPTDEYI